jgi:hypothetical protein
MIQIMEWEPVNLNEYSPIKKVISEISGEDSDEGVYALFRKGASQYLVCVVKLSEERA